MSKYHKVEMPKPQPYEWVPLHHKLKSLSRNAQKQLRSEAKSIIKKQRRNAKKK